MKILFGTHNQHKLREIRELLSGKLEVVGLSDVIEIEEVDETETTLEGNAILKAKTYAEATGLPCFADDTGLEVEALDGRPGVYSARYAGPACDPGENVQKLLGELQGKENRQAQFRTVIAYVHQAQTDTFEGAVQGEILESPKGKGGFGYDPVFLPKGYSLSFAELSADEKNAISHRGIAVRKFAEFLLAQLDV